MEAQGQPWLNHALVGIHAPEPSPDAERDLRRLAAAVGCSGVDATWSEAGLAVATRTLESGPPSRNSGPMCLVEGRVDNLQAIGRHLALPEGESPGRILTLAYERWGEGVLDRLRGAFVLVAWDPSSESGFVAADHLGGRAVFLFTAGQKLIFASEIRFLLNALPARPRPDPTGVACWMSGSGIPPEHTLYEGVRRLGAGSLLRFRRGSRERRRYWEPRYQPALDGGREDLAGELRRRMGAAIRSRVADDDVVGIMMSGGLDSSSVAGVAKNVLDPDGIPVRAYSAVFPSHPSIDETPFLDGLTAALELPGFRNHVYSGSALPSALEFLRVWQVPVGGPGYLFEGPLVDRAAADGVTVMIDGQGGDELFGFSPPLLADLIVRGRVRSAIELARRFPGAGDGLSRRQLAAVCRSYGLRPAIPYRVHRAVRTTRSPERYVPEWLNRYSARLVVGANDEWAWKKGSNTPRWWAQLADRLTVKRDQYGLSDYLRQRSAMAGISGRPPLFDVDLVDFMLRVPPEIAFEPSLDRPLLREAVKGLIPEDVRLRHNKTNFQRFYHESLTGRSFAVIERLLGSPDAEIYAYADREAVRASFLDSPPGAGDPGWIQWTPVVWHLAILESWLKSQSSPDFPQRLLDGSLGDLPLTRFALRPTLEARAVSQPDEAAL